MLPCHSNKLSLEMGAQEIEGSGFIKISCKSLANLLAAYILGVDDGPFGTPQRHVGCTIWDNSPSTVDIEVVLSREEDRERVAAADCNSVSLCRILVFAARGMHSR